MHAFHADINKRLSIVSAPSSMMGDALRKDSTLHVGAYEFCSNSSDKYFFANGYIDIEQGHVKAYCYYAKDHLGNVRYVDRSDPNTGRNEIVQIANYYPFGGIIDDKANSGMDVQNHLYNGKELDRMHGLNLYDYSARQYDATLGQFTSMDPLCEKYYHISPYAYCAGNPVKYVDPDGKRPRIYIETNGTGHTFVTVGEGKNTVVYTYGRYCALGSSGSVLHSLTPTGEGVLLRMTGGKAREYLKREMENGNLSVYMINGSEDQTVSAYFDKQWESGTRPTEKNAATDPDAKVVDSYNLFSNNCTTKSIEAINNGVETPVVPSSKIVTRTSSVGLGTYTYKSKEKVFAPSDLKKQLDEISKTNPQDIIRISNPEEFLKRLMRQLK